MTRNPETRSASSAATAWAATASQSAASPSAASQSGGNRQRPAAHGVSGTQRRSVRRLYRAAIWLLLITAIVGVLVVTAWPGFSLWRAAAAIESRNLDQADAWLDGCNRFGYDFLGTSRLFVDSNLGLEPHRLWLKARVARKLGEFERMDQYLTAAIAAGLPYARAERERWFAEAQSGGLGAVEKRLPQLLVDQQDDGREICEAYVNGYVLNYRLLESTQLLDEWQAAYPTDPMPWLFRGRIEEHRANTDTAAENYRKALEVDSRFAPAAYNLARLSLNKKQVDEARLLYQRAAANLSHPQAAEVGLAHCDRLQQRYPQSRTRLELVAAATDEDVRRSYRSVGDGAETAAVAPLVELGEVCLAEKDSAAAVRAFQQALERNELNHAVRYLLANALRANGQVAEAQQEYAVVKVARAELSRLDTLLEAVRKNPDSADARVDLGRVFLNYLNKNQGLVWLNSALSFDPNHVAANQILAEYYGKQAASNPRFADLAAKHAQAAAAALNSRKASEDKSSESKSDATKPTTKPTSTVETP